MFKSVYNFFFKLKCIKKDSLQKCSYKVLKDFNFNSVNLISFNLIKTFLTFLTFKNGFKNIILSYYKGSAI